EHGGDGGEDVRLGGHFGDRDPGDTARMPRRGQVGGGPAEAGLADPGDADQGHQRGVPQRRVEVGQFHVPADEHGGGREVDPVAYLDHRVGTGSPAGGEDE